MKKNFMKRVLLVVLFLILCLNVVAVFSPASGEEGKPKYMAGKWMRDQFGNIMGCSCPVAVGDCICQIVPAD